MPSTWLAKSKVSVSQSLATVVVASVSTEIAGSAEFSIFNLTWIPATGDQTRTVMVVLSASSGMTGIVSFGPVETTVPANDAASADRFTWTTLLAASVGSTTTVESSAPLKPRSA